jgi:hypothetical protein
MTTKKVISLSSVKQLLDLNGGSTNFDLTFTAKSLNNSDFYVIVVDQATLDSNTPLDFKLAKGEISANIVSDTNVYQNHFLCLKSDKPCDVEVMIDKKEIEPRPIPTPLRQLAPRQQQAVPSLNPPRKPSKTNWTMIFIVIALGAGFVVYYYFFNKNKKITSVDTPAPVPSLTEQVTHQTIILPSPLIGELESSSITQKNSISERLRSLLDES